MKTKTTGFVKAVATGLALVQWLTFLPGAASAAGGKSASASHTPYGLSLSADVSRILSVFENRIEDQELLKTPAFGKKLVARFDWACRHPN